MIRSIALFAGLSGAVALSQFPEFSQQYLQRLSGAVNELERVVQDFDQAATNLGQTRQEALDALPSDGMAGELGRGMVRSITRYERLSADLQALRATGPLGRITQPWNISDFELVKDTWSDFRPAVPTTPDGAVTAAIGYALGWLAAMLGIRITVAIFGSRRRRRP